MDILNMDSDEYGFTHELRTFMIPCDGDSELFIMIDPTEYQYQDNPFHIYFLTEKMWLGSFYYDGNYAEEITSYEDMGRIYIDFQIDSKVFLPSHDLFHVLWVLCKFRNNNPVIKRIFEDLIDEGYIHIRDFHDIDSYRYQCELLKDHERDCFNSPCDDCLFIQDSYSFEKLSDFNYKDSANKLILLDCKIKKISNPVLYKGKYKQKVVFYDDNTNFELEAILDHEVADYDKWKENDNVRLIGMYTFDHTYVERFGEKDFMCLVPFMKKINPTISDESEDSDVDIKLSRSQEVDGYDEWRNNILVKDDYKCVCCGLDKHLHVHHLFGYAENPNLAVDENNGVTLCKFCHERYHSIYGKKNINPRDFIEYISKYGV